MSFREMPVEQMNLNPMAMIGSDWWLITAGNEGNGYNNTMTAAWGHLGVIWERNKAKGRSKPLPTANVYIRPSRYTKEFVDREEHYTLSVLGEGHRKALAYLGSHSGRDGDKIATAGLTPVFAEGTTYFAQAKMVFVCRKLYHAPLVEGGFVDKGLINDNYPDRDFHEMYIGEILKILVQADEAMI